MSCVLLLSHRDNISSFSSRFFPLSFSFRAHTFLIVVFKLQRQCPLYPAVTGPFIARTERIIPRRFTIVQRPRSGASLPRARARAEGKLSSNWNFVAVRQFVHYPRFFAGSSTSSSILLLQLLFTPSLFPPPLFSRTLLT